MGFTPFQLAFRIEATMLVELELKSLRTAMRHGIDDAESLNNRIHLLEKLDKTRRYALQNYEALQRKRKL